MVCCSNGSGLNPTPWSHTSRASPPPPPPATPASPREEARRVQARSPAPGEGSVKAHLGLIPNDCCLVKSQALTAISHCSAGVVLLIFLIFTPV